MIHIHIPHNLNDISKYVKEYHGYFHGIYGMVYILYGINQTLKPVSGDKLMNNQKQTIKCTVV